MAELHSLRPFKGSRKKSKRVGRGHGSAHGITATRGTKGQRARSGGSKGLKILGLKNLKHQTPKSRGFRSIHEKPLVVNLDRINARYQDGETVNPQTLASKKILNAQKKRALFVKILGNGNLSKKLTFEQCLVSQSAREKIEKAGGTIQ